MCTVLGEKSSSVYDLKPSQFQTDTFSFPEVNAQDKKPDYRVMVKTQEAASETFWQAAVMSDCGRSLH